MAGKKNEWVSFLGESGTLRRWSLMTTSVPANTEFTDEQVLLAFQTNAISLDPLETVL